MIQREMNHNSANGAFCPGCDLEQSFAQSRHLRCRKAGACCQSPHLLHEDVSRRRHQDPKLVGREAGAIRAIHLETMMEFFDPVFSVP
jgi:hypothetical protein